MVPEGPDAGLFSPASPEQEVGTQNIHWKHRAVYASEATGLSCAFAWGLTTDHHKIFIQK